MYFRPFLAAFVALFVTVSHVLAQLPQPTAPQAPIVRQIDIQYAGPGSVAREKILANMRTRVGRPYSEATVEEDIRNLYNTGNIANVRIFGEAMTDGVKVIVVVQAKSQVTSVVITGASQIKESRLRKEISAKPNDALNEAALEQDRQKLQEYYSSRGFTEAEVRYTVQTDEKTGLSKVVFTINEAGKTSIRSVKFEGNQALKDGELSKVVRTKAKSLLRIFSKAGRLNSELLEDDARAIRELYQSRGYADAQVQPARITRQGTRVDIVFPIVEGPLYHVGKVSYTGANVFTVDELTRNAKVKTGEIYSPQSVRADVKTIQDLYGSRGYIDFQAGANTSPAGNRTVDVSFALDEGVQSYVEHVNISGNTRTKDKVIRRELALTPGEVYNTVRVDASKERLRNLNYFSKVESYPAETLIPGRRDLNILVEEKRTGSFNFGAGFSSIENLLGFAEITQGNFDVTRWPQFTGGGQKFRMRVQYGTRRKDFVISLTEPYFLDREISVGGELFYREASFTSSVYDERRYGFALSARKRLTQFTALRVGYRLENISILNVDEDASQTIRDEEGTRLKSEVSTGLRYDTRDSVFLTRKGEVVDLSAYVAGGFLGGDTDIYGFDLEASKYFLLPGDTILTIQGELAGVQNWAGGERVPIFDRLYLGGANNLRGFKFRDVGPKDEDGEPIGGNTLWRVTVEYTFPIVDKVRGAVFYDAGAVSAESWDVGGSMNSDVGIGVRLDLPIGPVRLDYGIPIQSDEFNDSSGKFQFNIGYQF
ncbi:MAG TPA: outer membrane protein assembly factor BamA [Chthoniobacteraceae bacterium]|jgi:outer membrane protein insertion porin family|nr:outer membrane protein assembly factor BamA [Chthoniobacteraceae bacterium]